LFPNSWDYGHTSWKDDFKEDKPEEIKTFQTRPDRSKSYAAPYLPELPLDSAPTSPIKGGLPTYKKYASRDQTHIRLYWELGNSYILAY
jgi:hypothetical protein